MYVNIVVRVNIEVIRYSVQKPSIIFIWIIVTLLTNAHYNINKNYRNENKNNCRFFVPYFSDNDYLEYGCWLWIILIDQESIKFALLWFDHSILFLWLYMYFFCSYMPKTLKFQSSLMPSLFLTNRQVSINIWWQPFEKYVGKYFFLCTTWYFTWGQLVSRLTDGMRTGRLVCFRFDLLFIFYFFF